MMIQKGCERCLLKDGAQVGTGVVMSSLGKHFNILGINITSTSKFLQFRANMDFFIYLIIKQLQLSYQEQNIKHTDTDTLPETQKYVCENLFNQRSTMTRWELSD